MRYFTFRFIHSGLHTTRDFTVAATHELDAQTAAWALLREGTAGFNRDAWRLLSIVIRPVIDLAEALAG